MPLAAELEIDPIVHDALAVQPLGDPELLEQIGGSLLEHASADAVLDVLSIAGLEHDALDAGDLEQPGEREPRRPGADDSDLGSQIPSSSSTPWKTWNALFAAATPQ
jgi:hypothetical protein